MRWSWTIGKIAGIRVRMHWTFLLLLAWVAMSYAVAGAGWLGVIKGVAFILAIFACVILHEAGHALVAKRFGVVTEDITLLPIGGMARMQRIPSQPMQELLIAVAGPAVNVAIAAVIFAGLLVAYGLGTVTEQPSPSTSFMVNLMWVNAFLVAFNILPAFPMDGGRILRAILATQIPYVKATRIAATIGQGMAILFGIVGLLVWSNPLLILIAIFVYIGAEAEAQTVETQFLLHDIPVRAAMMTRFRSLAPDDSVQTAVDELLAGAQQDFPVVVDGKFEGLLRRQDLVDALRERGPEGPIRDSIEHISEMIGEDQPLERALEVMKKLDCRSLPIFQNSHLVGLVTMDNVAELMMVRSARGGKQQTREVEQAVGAA